MKTILFTLVLLCSLSLTAQNLPEYKISKRFPLTGEGAWDNLTLQESKERLYIAHATQVQVLDLRTGKELASVRNLNGAHSIAIAEEFNKGFITSGRDTTVVVFDLNTYKTLSAIKIRGLNPNSILYDSFSKKVFVFNRRSSNVTVIDPRTSKVVSTIALQGSPKASVSNGAGKIFVNLENKNEICMINSTLMKVEQSWPVKKLTGPGDLAIDNTTHRLFAIFNSSMLILNSLTGKEISTLPIGDKADGIAFDPVLKRVYSANGEGSITVILQQDENHYKVTDTILTTPGARTIAIDKKSHHLYLPAAEYGSVPIPTTTNPHPHPAIKPNSFGIIDIEYTKL